MSIGMYYRGVLVSTGVNSINLAENLSVIMRNDIADIHSNPPPGTISIQNQGNPIGTFNTINFQGAGLIASNDGNYVATVDLAASFPIGMVVDFAGTTLPARWLWCDGAAVSRVTYTTLFEAVGTIYGPGDGATTFNIPDTRGRVVAGRDNMGFGAAGRITREVCGVNGGALGSNGGSQYSQKHYHVFGGLYDKGQLAPANTEAKFFVDYGLMTRQTEPFGTGNSQNVQPTIMLNKIIYTGVL